MKHSGKVRWIVKTEETSMGDIKMVKHAAHFPYSVSRAFSRILSIHVYGNIMESFITTFLFQGKLPSLKRRRRIAMALEEAGLSSILSPIAATAKDCVDNQFFSADKYSSNYKPDS